MNFKFKRGWHGKTNILISKMQVGCIAPSYDGSYFKICLAIECKPTWKWAVLKKTFDQECDARKYLNTYIDELLNHFNLYPIFK